MQLILLQRIIYSFIRISSHPFLEEKIKVLVKILKVKVIQSCLTLRDPMDYIVHGILQARILEWVAFPFSRGIFPTQGSNWRLLHCGQILYQLSLIAWIK